MPPMGEREIAGRYVLEKPIGRGGMGVVWRAHDRALKRPVALKQVLLPASADEDEDEAEARYRRLEREAQVAAQLSHPNIVTVHDVFRDDDGQPWLVMEYVESQSLDDLVAAQGPLSALSTGRIGQQLLDALTVAHDHGVLHRDVSPKNVLIAAARPGGGKPGDGTGDRAVLTDFGLALSKGDTRLTLVDQLSFHTAGYTAPERYRGDDATAASDLWSLGATLFTAVEGHGPFHRDSHTDTMSAVMFAPLPPAPSAGPLLGRLITALLDREPSARPSAAEAAGMLAEDLRLMAGEAGQPSFLGGAPPRPVSAAEPALPASIEPTPTSDDLLRQFAGEAGGPTRSARRVRSQSAAGRRRTIVLACITSVAIIVAAAFIGFAVFRHKPDPGKSLSQTHSAAPAAPSGSAVSLPTVSGGASVVSAINQTRASPWPGYTAQKMTASDLGTKAGFSLGIPPGWKMQKMGQQVYEYTPDHGVTYVEIDVTTDEDSSMVDEAAHLAGQDPQVTYPGYRRIVGKDKPYVQPERIRGTAGALWEFDYGSIKDPMRMDVLLCTLDGQSYTIYMTAAAGADDRDWNTKTLPIVSKILQTFEPLPA